MRGLPVARSLKMEASEFYKKHILMRELGFTAEQLSLMRRSDIEIHYDILIEEQREAKRKSSQESSDADNQRTNSGIRNKSP